MPSTLAGSMKDKLFDLINKVDAANYWQN